jgi:chaperonin GroES
VVACGPGFTNADGKVIPITVSVGDKVILPEFGGTPLKVEGEEDVILFRCDEILAKIAK